MSLTDCYTKLRKIGEGTFGKAWLVQNSKIDRLYVIKQIKISRVSNRNYIFLFITNHYFLQMSDKEKNLATTEVTILSKLSHLNIVSYIDSFISEDF